MSKGTPYTWMAALVALALGWGELVAYQDLTPHAQALLASDRSRAVLKAGEIVSRNLSALVVAAAGTVVLEAVKQTSQLYRLAQGATGEEGACPFTEVRRARAAGACLPTSRGWNADLGSGTGCPACPRCPAEPAGKRASSAGAPSDWAGVARALMIIKV